MGFRRRRFGRRGIIRGLYSLDLISLIYWKWVFFVFIIVDLIGFYWFLGWRSFALALLIVLIACVAVILFLMRRRQEMGEKMPRFKKMNFGDFEVELRNGSGRGLWQDS